MKVIFDEKELHTCLNPHRERGALIGFVPTMGALHAGHVSLLECCAKENPVSVLSIFVNPMQFGPKEDFSRYPRTLDQDLRLAEKAGISYVFVPTVDVIYPPEWNLFIEVTGLLTEVWCGEFRPGHFRGVATVVYRFFQMVNPTVAYFGQKDLQQCFVIKKMVENLRLSVRIEILPTFREVDGLAMSSRNRYLSPKEREEAVVLFRSLEAAKNAFVGGERNSRNLLACVESELRKAPTFALQYADLRSLPDFQKVERVEGAVALAIAGFIGPTRLIDNVVLGV